MPDLRYQWPTPNTRPFYYKTGRMPTLEEIREHAKAHPVYRSGSIFGLWLLDGRIAALEAGPNGESPTEWFMYGNGTTGLRMPSLASAADAIPLTSDHSPTDWPTVMRWRKGLTVDDVRKHAGANPVPIGNYQYGLWACDEFGVLAIRAEGCQILMWTIRRDGQRDRPVSKPGAKSWMPLTQDRAITKWPQ